MRDLRAARRMAHRFFDPLWEEGYMSRHQAYGWLAEQIGIPRDQCHIGLFDIGMCEAIADVCWKKLNQLRLEQLKHEVAAAGGRLGTNPLD